MTKTDNEPRLIATWRFASDGNLLPAPGRPKLSPMKINLKMKAGDAAAPASLDQAVLKAVRENVAQKTAGLVCPDHGQAAKVEIIGDSLPTLKFQVFACCDKLKKKVADALK